jgi:DNA-binding transcriptional MocR family regulator
MRRVDGRREDVLKLSQQGLSAVEIADELGVSPATVKRDIKALQNRGQNGPKSEAAYDPSRNGPHARGDTGEGLRTLPPIYSWDASSGLDFPAIYHSRGPEDDQVAGMGADDAARKLAPAPRRQRKAPEPTPVPDWIDDPLV